MAPGPPATDHEDLDPLLFLGDDAGGHTIRIRILSLLDAALRMDVVPPSQEASSAFKLSLGKDGHWAGIWLSGPQSSGNLSLPREHNPKVRDGAVAEKLVKTVFGKSVFPPSVVDSVHKSLRECRRRVTLSRFREAVQEAMRGAPCEDLRHVLDTEVVDDVHRQ